MRVQTLIVQVTRLVVPWQNSRQHVYAVRFVMKRRLGGEDEEMGAVLPPPDLRLSTQKGIKTQTNRKIKAGFLFQRKVRDRLSLSANQNAGLW